MKARLISFGGFLSGLVLLYLIPFGLDQLTTGRVFLTWPDGSIWSNMLASLWWLLIAGWTTWYLRDHIGRRLSGWWGKHHPSKGLLERMEAQVKEARDHALAARTIAADSYRRTHGEEHPLCPENGNRPATVVTGPLPGA